MSGAEKLLSACSKVRSTGAGQWIACCPAHADKSPSLTVRELEDGTVLAHCFAGCSIEEVTLAAGLTVGDLFPEKERPLEHRGPLSRPFDAHAVLQALDMELSVAYIIASDLLRDKSISEEAHSRLGVALERVKEARRLANGPRR